MITRDVLSNIDSGNVKHGGFNAIATTSSTSTAVSSVLQQNLEVTYLFLL